MAEILDQIDAFGPEERREAEGKTQAQKAERLRKSDAKREYNQLVGACIDTSGELKPLEEDGVKSDKRR